MAPRSRKVEKQKEKFSPPTARHVMFSSSTVSRKRGPSTAAKKAKLDAVTTKLSWRHKRGPGILLGFGMSEFAQLGLGEDVVEVKRPKVLNLSEEVMDVAAGGMHSVVLTAKGEVFTFGTNDEGALGRTVGPNEEESKPVKVEGLENVVQVTAGDSHSAALLEDGRVFAWGNFRDGNGQIGFLVKKRKETRPVQIMNTLKIAKICSGNDHLVALTDEGHLYTCGNGENGQLGRIAEYFTNRGGRRGLQLFLEPAIVRVKERGKGQLLFEDCWAGAYGTWAKVKDANTIFAFGSNNYNQLGIERKGGTNEGLVELMPKRVEVLEGQTWQSLRGSMHHSIALSESGKVHAMGRNDTFQCGFGNASKEEPFKVIPGISNQKVLEVSTGGNVSYALDSKGKVWAWGQSGTCQLGLVDDEEDVQAPIVIKGKNVDNAEVLTVSGGGQHTLLIVKKT